MQIPQGISLNKDEQYCLTCFSGPIKRTFRGDLIYYLCLKCGQISERSLVLDSRIKWWVDGQGVYWHESVGVLVMNEEKQILCLFRKIYPFAYTIPAGHLDSGEDQKSATGRELCEETGLLTSELEFVNDFDVAGDSCRRGSDHHRWHLYRCKISSDIPIKVSDEASRAEWKSFKELKNMQNVVYPVKYILETFGNSLIL